MRRLTPDMPRDVAQRIVHEECGDIKARNMLLDRCEWMYHHRQFEGCAITWHAMVYLQDRAAYEKEPWPKGKIKLFEDSEHGSAVPGGAR